MMSGRTRLALKRELPKTTSQTKHTTPRDSTVNLLPSALKKSTQRGGADGESPVEECASMDIPTHVDCKLNEKKLSVNLNVHVISFFQHVIVNDRYSVHRQLKRK